MSIELSYKDLKKELLSAQGLELLSEFALIWRTKTGEIIDLESEDLIVRVFRKAMRSTDRRLRSIYLHLRVEFSYKIENSFDRCDAMLADQLLSYISEGRTCRYVSGEAENRQRMAA